jgi:hypothetical protein
MTPALRAAQWHSRQPDCESFSEALLAHLHGGYVISTPEVFLLFRPVDSRGDRLLFDDPWHRFETFDTWHCYLAAGDLTQFRQFIPFDLPFFSYVRKNRLRVRPLTQSPVLYGRKTETRKAAGAGQLFVAAIHPATGGCESTGAKDRTAGGSG